MCGADVEFVAETQEEQEKLKERMSSANQHMEDSVVAAYAGKLIYSVPVLGLFHFWRLTSSFDGSLIAVWLGGRGANVWMDGEEDGLTA